MIPNRNSTINLSRAVTSPLCRALTIASLAMATIAPLPSLAERGPLMFCRATYGLEDFRSLRPEYVRFMAQHNTYYLFDNPNLFYLRIQLRNDDAATLVLAEGESLDWAQHLDFSVLRNDTLLSPDAYSTHTTRRIFVDAEYYSEGRRIENMSFIPTSGAPEPTIPFDDIKKIEEEVRVLPSRLRTNQEIIVEVKLSDPKGEDLALGDYLVKVTDQVTGEYCGKGILIVMREPEERIDIADSYIVRHKYYKQLGDVPAAQHELLMATLMAPDTLEAWLYFGSYANELGDLESQVKAAKNLAALLMKKSPDAQWPESRTLQTGAVEFASKAEQLQRQLDQLHSGKTTE